MDGSDTTGLPSNGATAQPRVYLEIDDAAFGWRYRVFVGIREVESGWRLTWKGARRAGRRARQPYLEPS